MKLKILGSLSALLACLGLATIKGVWLEPVASTVSLPTTDDRTQILAQTSEQVTEVLQQNGCPVCMRDGINLGGANLAGANFWSASLKGANFSRSNLAGANFSEANLTSANLRGANLRGANLRRANLSYADLTGAQLTNADLRDAILFAANLKNANLRGANITGAVMPSEITSNPVRQQPQAATRSRVADLRTIAKEITVFIDSYYLPGSGVIVAREGNTYYVLTAAHVVCTETTATCEQAAFNIVTHDGKQYHCFYRW